MFLARIKPKRRNYNMSTRQDEARIEYEKVERHCELFIKLINAKIAERRKKDEISWGSVSTLQHTRSQLKEVLMFFPEMDFLDGEDDYDKIERLLKS